MLDSNCIVRPVATLALVVLSALSAPAQAQDQPNAEAQRFLVYPPNRVISFSTGPDGRWYLHYYGRRQEKDGQYYNQVVQVTRAANEEDAIRECQGGRAVAVPGQATRDIPGFRCAYVRQSVGGGEPGATVYRSSWFAIGPFFGSLGEGASPAKLLPAAAPTGPLLAALRGEQPIGPAERAFRDALMRAMGLEGDTSRSCLDEVMNWAEGEADRTMRDQIAQLRGAARNARVIEVLSAMPAHPEDFDSQWWDALREVLPDPSAPPDPQDTATDLLVDALPPPFNTLVSVGRASHRGLMAARTHITDPKVRAQIYACYRDERRQTTTPAAGGNADAYEGALSHILLDATAACPAASMLKSSYEPQLRRLSGQAREDEYRRLIAPIAIRFEVIYRAEDARTNREARLREAWQPVQDLLGRLKSRVNACIAKRSQ
jgi:hypothetical protein